MLLNTWWKLEEPCPTQWSHLRDERLFEYPYNLILRATLASCKYKGNRYERPHYMAYTGAIEAEVADALTRAKTPEDAMNDARERCDEILEKEYAKYGGGYYDPWPRTEIFCASKRRNKR